jgi:hypothetical protein
MRKIMENMVGWERLFLSMATHIRIQFDSNPTLEQSKTSSMYSLQSVTTMVDTYKDGTPGDIPVTEVLIKGRSPLKHKILRWENNRKHSWLRMPVPSKATHIRIWFDSESNSETVQSIERQLCILTKKIPWETSQLPRFWLKAEAPANI